MTKESKPESFITKNKLMICSHFYKSRMDAENLNKKQKSVKSVMKQKDG